jgi:hypothetical protein
VGDLRIFPQPLKRLKSHDRGFRNRWGNAGIETHATAGRVSNGARSLRMDVSPYSNDPMHRHLSGGADNADYHLGGERLGSGLVALCCTPFSAMTGFDRFFEPRTRGNPRFVPMIDLPIRASTTALGPLEHADQHPGLLTYEQGIQAFRVTDRLSDSDRALLMGDTLQRVYNWAPSRT